MNFAAFPFFRYTLVLIGGIAAYLLTNFFHPSIPYFFVFSLGIFLLVKQYRGTIALFCLFLFAWLWTYYRTPTHQPHHYTHNTNIESYQARIISNAEDKPKTYKVEAEVQAIRQDKHWRKTSGKVLLYFIKTDCPKPNYGDIFLLQGTPRSIESPKNPYEFDYKAFMHNKGIDEHHFLRKNDFFKIGYKPQNPILQLAINANRYADSLFTTHIKTPHEYAVANAMVVGLRDDIDNELLHAYSASGAIHVLSVSGMHVAILYLVLVWCFKWLTKIPYGKLFYAIVLLGLLWAYAIFTGLSSTVLRATIMCSMVVLADISLRKHNLYNTLACSAFVLLLYNPYWIFDVGFQLSYLAIFGIVYLNPMLNQFFHPTNRLTRKLWELTTVSISAQLFTLPLSLYYFHQFPTYFLLANPFVFFFSEGVLPLGLLFLLLSKIPFLGDVILYLLTLSLKLLNYSIFAIEKLPLSTLTGFSFSIPEMLLFYLFIATGLLFLQKTNLIHLKIAFASLCILFGINLFQDYQQSKQLQITIHYIPKQSGISFIQGKSALFVSDSSTANNTRIYNFHLKNYYDAKGITQKNTWNTNENQLINFNSLVFFNLKSLKRFTLNQKIDYLIISNNACESLIDLPLSKIKTIILDDTNKKYLVQRLKTQAHKIHYPLISLYEHGAYVVN